jgi:hypothetical protein
MAMILVSINIENLAGVRNLPPLHHSAMGSVFLLKL